MPRHFWESAFQVMGTKLVKRLSGGALTASWFILHSLNTILHNLLFCYLWTETAGSLCVFSFFPPHFARFFLTHPFP